ncbi:hypothetical protein PG996_011003 [Apiospora saccharicola]|uniref:Uncharacterized protein n=1 Tax=Apiospora saccharicola TaxID=335842 RepID=A0ABR1UG34_9PEZI
MAAKFAAPYATIVPGEYREPEEPRYPIIIAADSPVSSPEKLQALFGLPKLPKVTTVKQVDEHGVTYAEPEDGGLEFETCNVDFDEWKRVTEDTEYRIVCVFFKGVSRNAVYVHTIHGATCDEDPEKAGTDGTSVATVNDD